MDALWDRFRIYQKLGEMRRKSAAEEIGRFEDDGGAPLKRVVICRCGATEDDPYCYCGC